MLKLRGSINNRAATFLVDSGASANFVDADFIKQNRLTTTTSDARMISLADGSMHRSDQRLRDAHLSVGDYEEKQTFTVLPLKGQSAILGLPWLTKNNANIDWRKRRILVKTKDRMHQLCMLGDIITSSASLQNVFKTRALAQERITRPSSEDKTRTIVESCSTASLASTRSTTKTRQDTPRRSVHAVRHGEKTRQAMPHSAHTHRDRELVLQGCKTTNQVKAQHASYAAALSAGMRTQRQEHTPPIA